MQLIKKIKNMKKTLATIFLFVICSFTIISCNKTNENNENNNSLLPDESQIDYKIKLANQEFELKKVNLTNNLEGRNFRLADSRISINEYNNFESNINLLLNENTKSILTVIYLNPNSAELNLISPESIIAISKYYEDGTNMLQHDFFYNIEGQFIKDKYLSVHVSTITNNGIFRVNEKVLKVSNNTILTITSDRDFKLKSRLDNSTDILRIFANSYDDLKREIPEENATEENLYLLVNKVAPSDGGNGCKGAPCYETGKLCYRSSGGISTCEPYGPGEGGGGGGGCLRNNNNSILLSNNSIPSDSLSTINNDSLHYNLRDFSANSAIGRKYINYYYHFGVVYQNKVTLPTAIETARFLYRFNAQINKLLNPTVYGQDIFFDSAMKNEIIDIINDYKNLYNDTYNNTLLNDILNDLNFYENKTVSQVLANL